MNLKPLVNNTSLYESFLEYLHIELDQVHKDMESAKREEFLIAQGDARRLRKFMKLKERVNDGS